MLGTRLRDAYAAAQVRRVRRAYTRISGRDSATPGYPGMVEEMRIGLATLADDVRRRADDRVFEAIFYGAAGLTALRLGFRWAPRAAARAMSRGSVEALRFLVGDIERDPRSPEVNHIPRCTFRAAGGEALCQEVCRAPTQRFCGERGIAVSLDPDPTSLACRWTWGG